MPTTSALPLSRPAEGFVSPTPSDHTRVQRAESYGFRTAFLYNQNDQVIAKKALVLSTETLDYLKGGLNLF